MKDKADYKPLLVFSALALAVMLPLLRPGYILSVDMVFTPHIPLQPITSSSFLLWAVLHVLNVAIASQLIEKALLFGILLCTGYSAYRLIEQLQTPAAHGTKTWLANRSGAYFAGVLYMFNPFMYSRFMAGQYQVLLGYALLPVFGSVFLKLCERPGWKRSLTVAAITAAIGVASIHALGFIMIIGAVLLGLFGWWHRRDRAGLLAMIKWAAAATAGAAVLSSYWLIPLLMGTSSTAHTIAGFTQADLNAFATSSRGFGVLGNVLGLQGFWADSQRLFSVPQLVFGWWWLPVVVLWFVVLGGIVLGLRRGRRGITIAFLIMGTVGVILATGTTGTIFAPLNKWLVSSVSLFAGYREPQKFVALIALAYAYFGSVAVGWTVLFFQSRKNVLQEYGQLAALILCAVPILCAPLMPWGFHDQLHAAEYPVEWDAVNDRLQAECTGSCQVLFLPWHLYMRYDFAGRIVADPAPQYFGAKIVSSHDPEYAGVAPYSQDATQRAIATTILPAAAHGSTDMAKSLSPYHIQYILLAKEDDYKQYGYLNSQNGLQVLLDTPTLTLYSVSP